MYIDAIDTPSYSGFREECGKISKFQIQVTKKRIWGTREVEPATSVSKKSDANQLGNVCMKYESHHAWSHRCITLNRVKEAIHNVEVYLINIFRLGVEEYFDHMLTCLWNNWPKKNAEYYVYKIC